MQKTEPGGLLPLILLAAAAAAPDPDAVRFPDSTGFRTNSIDEISPCEGGAPFCVAVADYPAQVRVDSQLLASPLVRQKIFHSGGPGRLRTRVGLDEEAEEARACRGRRATVYPRKAKNVRGQYLFIVNQAEWRQAVEVEQCEAAGQVCRTDSDAPAAGTTACRQQFAAYKLYAINENSEQVYDSFRLPSACICHHRVQSIFRSDDSIFGRGALTTRSQQTSRTSSLPFCPAGSKLQFPPAQRIPNTSSSSRVRPAHPLASPRPAVLPTQRQPDPFRIILPGRTSLSGRPPSRPRGRRQRAGRRAGRGRRVWRGRRGRARRQAGTCSGTYCSSAQDYPAQLTRRLLASTTDAVAGSLYSQVFDGECTASLATRNSVAEAALCDSRRTVVRPRKALNMKNEWKFVVNLDQFQQAVEVVECGAGQTSQSCLYSGSLGNSPGLTSCRQIFTQHKLLALTDEDRLEVDSFMLPSACACFIQNNLFSFQFEL